MIDLNNQKLREDMMHLLGKINAICFPLMWCNDCENVNQSYYDLIDSIKVEYIKILEQTIWYKND